MCIRDRLRVYCSFVVQSVACIKEESHIILSFMHSGFLYHWPLFEKMNFRRIPWSAWLRYHKKVDNATSSRDFVLWPRIKWVKKLPKKCFLDVFVAPLMCFSTAHKRKCVCITYDKTLPYLTLLTEVLWLQGGHHWESESFVNLNNSLWDILCRRFHVYHICIL